MNTHERADDGTISASMILATDEICGRFEAAWREGKEPRIEDFLESPAVNRRTLLWQLLQLEWGLLAESDQTPDEASYVERFSDEESLVRSALKVHQGLLDDTVEWSDVATHSESGDDAADQPRSLSGMLGDYEFVRLLGRGAFGAVYLAQDTKLNRSVALKIPRNDRAQRRANIDAMMSEARMAAQLKHPNIVAVFEAGEIESVCYIATDYVPGRTLRNLIDTESLSEREVVKLLRKIAVALHHAHAKGIFHRDVKPANILIDEQGEPHVADFGLARWDALNDTGKRKTRLGTPAYMSPEQAQGESHLADARSDLWSVGVMMFEMLSGQRPFKGNAKEVMRSVCDSDAPALRAKQPAAPLDLEAICGKCLARDPELRYPSCQHLADDLIRWLEHRPVQARPVGVVTRASLWCRRQPLLAAILLIVASLLIWSTTATMQSLRAEVRNAELERETARRDRERRERDIRNSFYQDAVNAAQTGNWSVVAEKARRALDAEHPEQVELMLMRTRAFTNLLKPKLFREELKRVAALPDQGRFRGEVLLLQAEVAMLEGNARVAKELYDNALAAGLTASQERYVLGLRARTVPEAISHFKAAIADDPYFVQAWTFLCLEQTFLGAREEARKNCNIAHGRFPQNPAFIWLLAIIDTCEGNEQSAAEHLAWLKQHAGENFFQASELTLDLIREAHKIVKLDQKLDSMKSLTLSAQILAMIGRTSDQQLVGLPLPTRLKEDFAAMMVAAPGYLSGLNRQGMEAVLIQMIETRPEATHMLMHGVILVLQGREREAAEIFTRATEAPSLFPESNRVALTLACLTSSAVRNEPDDPAARHALAWSFAQQRIALGELALWEAKPLALSAFLAEEYEMAKLIASEQLEKTPGDTDLMDIQMLAYYRLGSYSKSLEVAEQILEKDADHKKAAKYRDLCRKRLEALNGVSESEEKAAGKKGADADADE